MTPKEPNRIPWATLPSVVAILLLIPPLSAQDPEVLEDFPDPVLLISTSSLEPLLDDPSVRIVDARESKDHQAGHLPHAVNVPASSLEDPESRIKGNLLNESALAGKMGLAGIDKDTHVVVYDDHGGRLAARLVWVLHYLGHPLVSILEGGLGRWKEEGRFVTQEVEQLRRKSFQVDPVPRRLATADWVLHHSQDPDVVIVDSRPAALYEEDHIPGAINIPWDMSLRNDGKTWKKADDLLEMFESRGVTSTKNVVVYSEVGGMNSLTYAVLTALGYPRVRSYERSWAEWGGDYTLPKTGKSRLPLPTVKAIFRANGCATCHMVSSKPLTKGVNFTDEGIKTGQLENGCIRLLTKIVDLAKLKSLIAQQEAEKTRIAEQQAEATKKTFRDHGCVKCHDIEGSGATAANLTNVGLKYQGMNLGCLDMMFDLR